jgi:hypothetical protein
MPDINDLLGNAIDKNALDFADTFNQIMQQKQADAIEARRVELAQSMYVGPEDEDDSDDVGEDEFADAGEDLDDDDIDIDELDLDDLDIDLEDLDLEDSADDEDA